MQQAQKDENEEGQMLTRLWALSPLDGRYGEQLNPLAHYMSEAALMRYRLKVEGAWLLYLQKLASEKILPCDWTLSAEEETCVRALMEPRGNACLQRIKEIEKTTRHDVKAVEYLMREELQKVQASPQTLAFVHFACTSEDINNLSYALMLRDASRRLVLPTAQEVIKRLAKLCKDGARMAMLARTHGQTASPTTLGKECAVFGYRLMRQYQRLSKQVFMGKINGAVGNYNAHLAAFPQVDWPRVTRNFIEIELGLHWNPWTTQIESHDFVAEYCEKLRLYNTISIDLARDLWTYISMGYFKQKVEANEVGSSTMPHKVNPIDFENAEGNFGLSSSLAEHFSAKLPISRLQRDLSDSTVLRSLGVMLGYHVLAQKSLLKGLDKIASNPEAMGKDLSGAWEVVGEAVQTVLRAHGIPDAYEILKHKTRGKPVTREGLSELIQEHSSLLSELERARLAALTPENYIGLAAELAQSFVDFVGHEFN